MTAQVARKRLIVKPGVYEHYKGGLYRVLYYGRHTERDEEVVVYQSISDGQIWVRPLEMFTGRVTALGVSYKRFKLLDNHNLFFLDEYLGPAIEAKPRRRLNAN